MPTDLLLRILRHGETPSNSLGIVQGQGVDDSLNDGGFLQAVGVGRSMRSMRSEGGGGEVEVWCSDLARARETARGFEMGFSDCATDEAALEVPDRAVPVSSNRCDPRLRERAKGAQEGRLNNLSMEEAERMDEEEGREGRLFETYVEVRARLEEWLGDAIRDRRREEEGGDGGGGGGAELVVVTHGGCIRTFLRDVFAVSGDRTVKVFNGSVSTVKIRCLPVPPVEVAPKSRSTGVEGEGLAATRRVAASTGEVFDFHATLVGDLGDISFIPPEHVTKRSDW